MILVYAIVLRLCMFILCEEFLWFKLGIYIYLNLLFRFRTKVYFLVILFYFVIFFVSYYILMINLDILKEVNKLLKINFFFISKI